MTSQTLLLLALSSFFHSFAFSAAIEKESIEAVSPRSTGTREISTGLVKEFGTISLLESKSDEKVHVLGRRKRSEDRFEVLESSGNQIHQIPIDTASQSSYSNNAPRVIEDLDELFLLAESQESTTTFPADFPFQFSVPNYPDFTQESSNESSDDRYFGELTETIEDVLGIPRGKRNCHGRGPFKNWNQ